MVFFETDNHYPFSFLRNAEIKPIENLVMNEISQVFQMIQNNLESSASVMSNKLLYILQQKRLRLFRSQNSFHVKKQSSSHVGKSQLVSDNAKRLTRKAACKNIVIRNLVGNDFRDIAKRFFAKVRFVHDLARRVPFGSENTFSADSLKSDTDTAYTRKKIYKRKSFVVPVAHNHVILFYCLPVPFLRTETILPF